MNSLPNPLFDVICEGIKVIYSLDIFIYFVPVNAKVFMNENISEASHRCNIPGKIHGQNIFLTQEQKGAIVIQRLFHLFQGNNAICDVYTTLNRYFQISFNNIPQIGVLFKIIFWTFSKRLQFF